MQSMTGFGQGTARDTQGTLTVQIAAVNHRGCQIQIRNDLRDLAADELVRNEVRRGLERGAITVQVRVAAASALAIDKDRLIATWRELAATAQELGAPIPALEHVATLLPNATSGSDQVPEGSLKSALATALEALRSERRREGAALAAAFCAQAGRLRSLMPRLHELSAARATAWREHLTARLAEVLAEAPLPDGMLVREMALYCDRVDVTEELVRLAAHLDALDRLIAETIGKDPDGGQGRRLEFLLQEIAREVNTTGSKSNDSALTGLVLEAKSLVEQMKEQAANVL